MLLLDSGALIQNSYCSSEWIYKRLIFSWVLLARLATTLHIYPVYSYSSVLLCFIIYYSWWSSILKLYVSKLWSTFEEYEMYEERDVHSWIS